MGSACCVAARDETVGVGSGSETQRRNIHHSPSWSFRWDHPGRVVGEEVPLNSFSDGISRNDRREFKYESSYASEEGSPLEHFRRQTWKNSSVSECSTRNVTVRTPTSGSSISGNISMDVSLEQVKKAAEYPTSTSPAKVSHSIPSTSSLSASPLSTHSQLPPASLTSSRLSRCSPGHRLLRQVSGNRIPGYKSPNSYTVSEERRAIHGSNDSLRGSHGGSSDGWSMNAFSELMATSHRGRWSFGSESFDFAREKTVRSCSLFSTSPSDTQSCGICSMLLLERSLWTSQKITANNELSVIAVLTCGHVYHAECLENMTPEISKYDPACPICSFGEKQTLRMFEKALRGELELKIRNKRLRNRIVDSGRDNKSTVFDHFINGGQQGKCSKLSSSSSLRASSGKGFLRRHFSFGLKGGIKAVPESSNTAKRKGLLWSRSTKM